MNDGPITDAFRYSNYVEGFFWIGVGLLAWKAARDRALPRLARAYLGTLIVFGFSDWVESTTGAWWRPWWLFAWKAACVAVLVGLTVAGSVIVRRRTAAVTSPTSSPPAAGPDQTPGL